MSNLDMMIRWEWVLCMFYFPECLEWCPMKSVQFVNIILFRGIACLGLCLS